MHVHFFINKEELENYQKNQEAIAISEKYVEGYENFIIHASVYEKEIIHMETLQCEDKDKNEHFIHIYTIKKEK